MFLIEKIAFLQRNRKINFFSCFSSPRNLPQSFASSPCHPHTIVSVENAHIHTHKDAANESVDLIEILEILRVLICARKVVLQQKNMEVFL